MRLLVLFMLVVAPNIAFANDYITDEEGRTLRTTFPSFDRLYVDGGGAYRAGSNFVLGAGIDLQFRAEFDDEEIWWRLRHQFTRVEWSPESRRFGLVRGRYLRHDGGSYILIPVGRTDIKFPAPFDIAIDYDLGTFEFDHDELASMTIGEFALMSDWIRDPSFHHRFAFGPLARYTVDLSPTQHHVTPLTGLRVLYGYSSPTGRFSTLWSVDGRVDWTVDDDVRRELNAELRGEIEWVFAAINDRPISLFANGVVDAPRLESPTGNFGIRLSQPMR